MKLVTALVFTLLFVLLPLASAEITELKATKVGDCREIVQQDSQTATENLTFILRPDGTTQIIGKFMQANGNGAFNYSYCNTSIAGTYVVNGVGNYSGSDFSYQFNVTHSGYDDLGIFLFIFIAIILLIYVLGFQLENAWLMTLGSILVLIFGFFIIKFGIDIVKDTQTTWAIGLVIWAIGIYSLYLSVEEQLKNWG